MNFIRQHPCPHGHADTDRHPLPQWTGCGLNAGSMPEFRMSGGPAVKLPKLFQVIQRQIIAGQVKHAVKKHGRMSAGQNEAIAARPIGVGRIMAQVTRVEEVGDGRGFHRGARMPGTRFFNPIGG